MEKNSYFYFVLSLLYFEYGFNIIIHSFNAWFGKFLVAFLVLYTVFQCQLRSKPVYRHYYYSCMKKPANEPGTGPKPRFLDFVNTYISTIKKTIFVQTGKDKKGIIQAISIKSRIVCHWINKKKHCFQKVKKTKQMATKKLLRLIDK